MKRWRWRAQSSSLLRWIQGNAALHTATLQKGSAPLSRRQTDHNWDFSFEKSNRKVVLQSSDVSRLLPHECIPPNLLGSRRMNCRRPYTGMEMQTFATLEIESGSHDSLMEVQIHKICAILNGGGWDSTVQECVRPFVKSRSTGLVARVLNHVIDVETTKSFFDWVAKQDGYKHNIYVYNALVMKLGLAKDSTAVRRLLDEMRREDCAPNNTTFSIIIQCYEKAGLIEECWQVLKEADEFFDVKTDAHIHTTLMHVLFDAGLVKNAKLAECRSAIWS